MVVEYHGSTWHPNKDKLTSEEWSTWRNPFNQIITADEKYNDDQYKKKIAESNGFTYFEIWDTDDKDVVLDKILNAL